VNQLTGLVAETRQRFDVKEVSADKAYASRDNYGTLDQAGIALYATFRSNTTGSVGGVFDKMFRYFILHREEFLQHYHRRSNVESVFSMVKRKFGDSVRSKTDTAMKNEALCKLLAHNLCCLIAAWYELGIEPTFFCKPEEEEGEPRQILRFPGD
jgi:transposase